MKFIRRVSFDTRAPRGFGRAWIQWDSGFRICMPIPFNYIAGMGRAVYLFVGRGFYPHPMCPTCHHRSDKQLPVTPRHEIAGASIFCPVRGYVQSCDGYDCVGARCSILNPPCRGRISSTTTNPVSTDNKEHSACRRPSSSLSPSAMK